MRRIAAFAVLVSLVMGGLAVPAVAEPGPSSRPYQVTLITGDRITVRSMNGQYVVQSDQRGTFRQQRVGGRHYVIPIAAAGLVSAGVLDRQLFELDTLIRSGVDDGSRSSWPLILQYADGGAARASRSGRVLPLVDSVAVEQPKSELPRFWQRLGSSGVRRVWLDAGVRPLLDGSAGQIGTPSAWATGLTGKGVRVAVLDSGYDTTHPDLKTAVIATKDFTTPPDAPGQPLSGREWTHSVADAPGQSLSGVDRTLSVDDEVGHGTHVASIVAGSGGRFRGVAPDADLLIGKVCGRGGCALSSIIAGMEWAAASGAKVVNLSLGGGPSDGSDPLSRAVDEISARTGVLFVVAAGNSGEFGAETVTSPAVADAALAVGSVTKSDSLSAFSSRGPRPGNSGLKPDLTAPGDRIAAARAAGTLPFDAIDERYAELSGTSMAAPHVAGAAALLAQQHPDWDAVRLKAALMSSATPNRDLTVYEQGAGRLDVGRAVRQPVVAEPAGLDLGIARWPHYDDPTIRRTVTYNNSSDRPITLALKADVRGSLVRLGRRSITVPAHGTARLTVEVDTRTGPDGRYAGWIVAHSIDGRTTLRTPVGIDKEVESHEQSIQLLDRNGKPAGQDPDGFPLGFVTLVSLRTGGFVDVPLEDGAGKVRLPVGDYLVDAAVITQDDGVTLIADPRKAFRQPGTTVLDARAGRLLTVDSPRPDAHSPTTVLGFVRGGYYGAIANVSFPDETPRRLYAVPTKPSPDFTAVVTAFWAKPSPVAGGTAYDNSPYLYNQIVPFPGRIPTDLHVRTGDFTEVRAGHASDRDGKFALKWMFPWLGSTTIFTFIPAVGMTLPFERREFYSKTGSWSFAFEQYADEWYSELEAQTLAPRGATGTERWNGAVFGPGLPDPAVGGPPWPPTRTPEPWAYRDGDSIQWTVPLFSDGSPDRAGTSRVVAQSTALFRDGQLLRRTDTPYQQVFRVPPERSRYRLETTANRDDFGVSTTVSTSWSFRSAHTPAGSKVPLPLLAARFSPDLDLHNRAPGAVDYRIPLTVQHQGSDTLESLTVDVSYDDGRGWQPTVVRRVAGGWTASVTHPRQGWVSLRARASDTAGNSVDQTILRAYELSTK